MSVRQRNTGKAGGSDAPPSSSEPKQGGKATLRAGVRTYLVDELSETPPAPPSLVRRVFAAITLGAFTGVMYILIALFVLSILGHRWALVALVLMVSTAFLPAQTHWQGFMDSWLFKCWRSYFTFSAVFDEVLDAKQNYIMAEFPHGIMPFGPILAGSVVDQLFEGMKVYAISASAVFRTPIYRQFMSWLGAQPATKENFKKLLQKGSCAVVVGGVAEMYMQDKKKERVKINSRQGFVRVAVESGVPVVPIYHFGCTRSLEILGQNKIMSTISRKLRLAFMIIYGRFFLPIPYEYPIMMAVGKPVQVKQTSPEDDGFDEEVQRVHKEFTEALADLYDRHKEKFGWKDIPMQME